MNKYKSSGQLKGIAKDQLFGHYGTAIGALLLVGIITLIITCRHLYEYPAFHFFRKKR